MNVSTMRRPSTTIIQCIMVAGRPRTSRAAAAATVANANIATTTNNTKRQVHSYPVAFYSSPPLIPPYYDVQHQLYRSSGWSGLEAAEHEQLGYRFVSPSVKQQPTFKTTSCSYDDDILSEEDFLIKDAVGATVAYDPCYIGSSFLPQQDDLYEQQQEEEEVREGTTSAAAEVLAAQKEWDDDMLSTTTTMSTLESSMHHLQNRRLAAEVMVAHNEWDDLLASECDKPPHFECLKEDPYLSDYEEMLPHHVRDLKLVTHCYDNDLDDDHHHYDHDYYYYHTWHY